MKSPEADDPMELHGVECDGDPGFFVDCVVEEYLRMGWPPEQVFHLFESPLYPPLYRELCAQGAEAVRQRICEIASRCGVFRFRTWRPAELVTIAPLGEGGCEDD